MKRKEFFKTGLAAGIGSLIPFNRRHISPAKSQKARNIIFFAYDGFSWEDFSSAQHYSIRNFGRPLHLQKLFQSGNGGSMASHSLTSMVTDSSAATTAWSTGRKIVNGSLSIYPDGNELTTILELAKAEGKATGIVTTTRITHATPAGWIAKHLNRRAEEEIADQFANFRADVMIGGGTRVFDHTRRSDGKDLFRPFIDAGYTVVTDPDKLASAGGSKLLATLNNTHIPYEIDRKFRGVKAPSLLEMSRKGVEVLNNAENGFVLHIEAGRIDHANHRNDAGTSLWETLAADETLGMLMDYTDRTPGTLLIMASDHATGGPCVYGVGERYRASSEIHEMLKQRTASFDWIMDQLDENPSEAMIKDVIEDATRIRVTSPQALMLQKAIAGDIEMPDHAAFPRQPIATIHHILKGGTNDEPTRLNINYATTQHTAGAVPAALYGNNVETKPFGLIDNTDLFTIMTDTLGIDYRNPEMSAEKALEFYR